MRDLDDLTTYATGDPSNMGSRINNLPDQCRDALNIIRSTKLSIDTSQISGVVLAGMGGSSVGADMVADLLNDSKLPILTWRDYDLPSWVNKDTLVVVTSYSGDTDEALSVFLEAIKRGSKIVAITNGGQLLKLCKSNNVPAIIMSYEGEPRTTVGYSFICLLGVLQILGLTKSRERELDEAILLLDSLSPRYNKMSQSSQNPAKMLATDLYGKFCIVYGADFLKGVARRWKTQINENSKSLAFSESFPDLNHNSVVGFALPEILRERAMVILLRSKLFPQKILSIYKITLEILEKHKVPFREVDVEGEDIVSQILSGVYLGDYTSYYLAIKSEVDPCPVSDIDYFKDRLAELN